MNVFLRLFFFFFFFYFLFWLTRSVLLKLDPLSGRFPAVAQRAALSHRIFYFAFVSSAILYVLVLDLGDLICSGLVWPHRRKNSPTFIKIIFILSFLFFYFITVNSLQLCQKCHCNSWMFLSFIYYFTVAVCEAFRSGLNIPPVPVNVRSLLKTNRSRLPVRKQQEGGRRFSCVEF